MMAVKRVRMQFVEWDKGNHAHLDYQYVNNNFGVSEVPRYIRRSLYIGTCERVARTIDRSGGRQVNK
jgi:hypothetical protein